MKNPTSHIKYFMLTVMLACLLTACGGGNEGITSISAETFFSQQDNMEALIVDVRSPAEYQAGHVPGAINIPHTTIEQQIGSLAGYKDKPVVLYCKSGRRAGIAGDVLLASQFSQLYHLEGDMDGWYAAGHPVEK